MAEAIATAIREHVPGQDGEPPITASVGIAMFGSDPRTSFESVLSEADTAMYAAKDAGRDGCGSSTRSPSGAMPSLAAACRP